jgi:L-iditol 2-dehydrogenase
VLATQVAQRAGARKIYLSEPLPHRRDTALRFGVDAAWAPEDASAAVLDATAGRGVDVVIEMAGGDSGIETAVDSARPGARVALGGIPSDGWSRFPATGARRKGLTFVMVRRMHETYPAAIALATSGIDLDPLVSVRYPLRDAAKAFTAAAERTGDKVVVAVSGDG